MGKRMSQDRVFNDQSESGAKMNWTPQHLNAGRVQAISILREDTRTREETAIGYMRILRHFT